METNVKLIGANIPSLSPTGRKYFIFLVMTGTNQDGGIEDYLRTVAPNFSAAYQKNGAQIDCDSYSNDNYGVALFWYIADSTDGVYNERDFNMSEGSSFRRDIESILADNDYENKPRVTIVTHADSKESAIAKLQAVRKDVVFKNDLFAGKLIGEAIEDVQVLYDINTGSKPDTSDDIDLDAMTKDAEKPLEIIRKEKEDLENAIRTTTSTLEGLRLKLKNLNDYLQEQEMKANPNNTEEPPKVEDKFMINDIVEKANHPSAVLPKAKVNTATVTRTEEEVKEKESKLSEVNKMLDNLDINVGVTETEVKEEIKKETPVVTEVLTKNEEDAEIPDKKDATSEVLLNKEETNEVPKTPEELIDTPTKTEVIYDNTNQTRDISAYIKELITSDEDFSGDWDNEQELFQILMSNDDRVRQELSKPEYKAYLDLVTRYSLNDNDRQELNTGVYNLRKAKYDNIGAFDYVNE